MLRLKRLPIVILNSNLPGILSMKRVRMAIATVLLRSQARPKLCPAYAK